eukprot:1191228-Prorocentrum_minimum.AAC.3
MRDAHLWPRQPGARRRHSQVVCQSVSQRQSVAPNVRRAPHQPGARRRHSQVVGQSLSQRQSVAPNVRRAPHQP